MAGNKRYATYYDASIDEETLDPELSSSESDGLMSKEDKAKLDSIPFKNGKISIDASNVITNESYRFVSDVEKTAWNNKADRTLATDTKDGLMSKEDKAKLDSLSNSSSGSVFNADTHYDFPSVGLVSTIYKAYKERKTYQWNQETLKYELLDDDNLNIKIINGGNANANYD